MREGRKIYGELRAEEHKITDAAEEFFRHNEAKGLAEESKKTYMRHVNAFIKWAEEYLTLDEITPKVIMNTLLLR